MSENVIRKDTIELSFESNTKVLKEILSELNSIKKAVSGVGDNDGMDDLKKQTKKATAETKGLNDGLKKIGSTLGDISKKAARITFKGMVAGIGAATVAMGGLLKQSISAYAEYEQLVGGVDTLFGKNDSKEVQKYANDAFKTAGLSANEYMKTVTGFSASLLQSVKGDTKKAAKISNQAIIDMADNANKMGTDMGSIQYAYQGFAKQNYQMLDNLKLGYGGTKKEMERLLKDASKLAGKDFNISSYADVIEAIHVIQKKMGITGTTAKEASTTIQGSLNSMKSAWGNLLPALIQGGDAFDQCVDNLVDSASTFGKNIMPAVEKALEGIGKLIERAAPLIEKYFPKLVEDLLPPLIKAGTSLFVGFAKALPTIVMVVIKEIPNIVKEIWNGFAGAFSNPSNAKDASSKITKSIAGILGGSVLAGFVAFKGKKIFDSIKGVFSNVGGVSKEVNEVSNPLKNLASLNAKVLLKGLGNLAIVIGGLTLIAAALALVAPHIASLTDTKSFLKLVGAISMCGVVGSAITKLAALIGVIPVAIVLKGLGNIALVLGGMTAIIAAFGALSKIPGFQKFIESGGDMLATLFKQIGKIGGALVGGLGESISNSLPKIGKNFTAFAKAIKPMITTFKGADVEGIAKFFKSSGGFLMSLAKNKVMSLFSGETNLLKAATQLNSFSEKLGAFFKNIAAYPENAFKNSTLFFKSLSGISSLPKASGLKQWFGGETDFTSIANGLKKFGSAGVMNFFKLIATVPANAFNNAKLMFKSLAGVGSLPKEGGIKQFFTGKTDLSGLATKLPAFGRAMGSFYKSIAGISDFNKIKQLFSALKGVSSLAPKEGGLKQLWTGSGNLVTLGEQLAAFGIKAKSFFAQINSLNMTNLKALPPAISAVVSAFKELKAVTISKFNQMVVIVKKACIRIIKSIRVMANKSKSILNSTNLAPSGAKMMNSLIYGLNSKRGAVISTISSIANSIRGKLNHMRSMVNSIGVLGSNIKIPHFAKGTNGHKGGSAIVNDGRGAELVQMPNGKSFIPGGKNVLLPNAPKGMKVLNAEKTASLMGRKSPSYSYANGGMSPKTCFSGMSLPAYTPNRNVSSCSSTTVTENSTYAPVFNLTISGTTDDRAMASKVKRWVKEAMDECFESMARNNATVY